MYIWDNFSSFSLVAVSISFLVMLIGIAKTSTSNKLINLAIGVIAFLLITGLGQSQDLMHLRYSIYSALILVFSSTFIAVSSYKLTQNKWALLSLVPVSLIVFVFFYNLQFKDLGISLFGSWIA